MIYPPTTHSLNEWLLTLDSAHIQPDTLGHIRRHPCLSRAATSASSQVNPIFRRSLLTMPLQFALGRPGPLLYPGTCQYSARCGMRWWSIRKTWPSQRSRLSLSMLSMVCCLVLVLISTLVILSFHETPSILLCHLWCAASRLFVSVAVNGHTSAPYGRVDRMIASYALSSLSDWHCCFSRYFSFYQILLLLFQFVLWHPSHNCRWMIYSCVWPPHLCKSKNM